MAEATKTQPKVADLPRDIPQYLQEQVDDDAFLIKHGWMRTGSYRGNQMLWHDPSALAEPKMVDGPRLKMPGDTGEMYTVKQLRLPPVKMMIPTSQAAYIQRMRNLEEAKAKKEAV